MARLSPVERKTRARDRKAFVKAMLRVLRTAALLGPVGNEILTEWTSRRLANLERERREVR